MRSAAQPPPVHFRGVVLGPSGFAAQGREWLQLLEDLGLRPSLHGAQLGDVAGGESEQERALIARCAARPPQPGRITVHHVLPPGFEPDAGARADIVLTVFETRGLPPGWGASLDRAAAVVVPANEIEAAFVRGGVAAERVHAIAPPVALDAFAAPSAPWSALPPRRPGVRRLLAVFDWSLRKGIDVLLPAFARAVGPDEGELVLKVASRPGLDPQALQARCRQLVAQAAGQAGHAAAPQVHVVDGLLSASELPSLYAGADALVLPSRGEGWGRPVHEAMAAGLPVVATQAGALATLLPDASVGYPVRSRCVHVSAAAAEEAPCFAGQQWWEPDPDDLVHQLRACVRGPDEARARGRRARAHVHALCEPGVIARRFCGLLDAVVARTSSLAAVGGRSG